MTTLTKEDYTVIVYKTDKRTKEGERRIKRISFEQLTQEEADNTVSMLKKSQYKGNKYRIELHKTWKTRYDSQTGDEFKEYFETPFGCSRSSESYYAM